MDSSCPSSLPTTASIPSWHLNHINAGPAVKQEMPLAKGFIQLGAGLAVGLAGLAAGFAIGIVGDAGVRGTAQQPRLFVGMVCLRHFFKQGKQP